MPTYSALSFSTLASLATLAQLSLAAPQPAVSPSFGRAGWPASATNWPAGATGFPSGSESWSTVTSAGPGSSTGWPAAPSSGSSAINGKLGALGALGGLSSLGNLGGLSGLAGLFGAANGRPNISTSSTICYTSMGVSEAKSRPGTSWFSHSTAYGANSTTTVTTTTTAVPVTTTTLVVVTSTAAGPTSVNTATSVVITTKVATITAPVSTSILTSTTNIALNASSIVPASVGFLPVQSTLPNATEVPMRKRTTWGTSSTGSGSMAGSASGSSMAGSMFGSGMSRTSIPFKGFSFGFNMHNRSRIAFPQNIRCHVYHGAYTTSIRTLTVTSTAPASTVTVSRTSTVVITSVPSGASTTVTATSTLTSAVTIIPTTTSTTTLTQTTYTSTLTSYAACATNNLADQISGQGILGVSAVSLVAEGFDYTSSTSAYDCCVDAILNPLGAAFVYSTVDNSCAIFESSTCTTMDQSGSHQASFGSVGAGYIVGNAYCGSYDSGIWSA